MSALTPTALAAACRRAALRYPASTISLVLNALAEELERDAPLSPAPSAAIGTSIAYALRPTADGGVALNEVPDSGACPDFTAEAAALTVCIQEYSRAADVRRWIIDGGRAALRKAWAAGWEAARRGPSGGGG